MRIETIDTSVVRVTFIHCTYPKCSHCAHEQKTLAWLLENFNQYNAGEILPIVVVQDPKTRELMVYDGNIRTDFAKQKGIQLKAVVLTSQADLEQYLSNNSLSWFGIRDFAELLEYMRIYVQYPNAEEKMPPDLEAKIRAKDLKDRADLQRQRNEMYGWYDDD